MIDVAVGSILAGARAPLGTSDDAMKAAVRQKIPGAVLHQIKNNYGKDGVKIILWRYE